jgi:exopolysaccharide production protein ExoY
MHPSAQRIANRDDWSQVFDSAAEPHHGANDQGFNAADQGVFLTLDEPLPDEASTMELVAQEEPPVRLSLEAAAKRALDIVGALLLSLIFSPLILAIFLATRKSVASPIFKHKRVGLNGEQFECLKFRTMVPDAERVLAQVLASDPAKREEWLLNHKLRDDPRVTRIGQFLRSTSLDELPQLWNVLKGEMSLVGPRPVTREETLRYGRNMVMYMMVKPGITGLWQVSGRSNTDYRRRVAIDVCYVRNQSLLLDLWILLKTTTVVVGRHGAC